jgi:hypothetical protein
VVVVEKVKRRGPGHGEVKLATPTAAPPPATLAALPLAPGKTEAPSTKATVALQEIVRQHFNIFNWLRLHETREFV